MTEFIYTSTTYAVPRVNPQHHIIIIQHPTIKVEGTRVNRPHEKPQPRPLWQIYAWINDNKNGEIIFEGTIDQCRAYAQSLREGKTAIEV